MGSVYEGMIGNSYAGITPDFTGNLTITNGSLGQATLQIIASERQTKGLLHLTDEFTNSIVSITQDDLVLFKVASSGTGSYGLPSVAHRNSVLSLGHFSNIIDASMESHKVTRVGNMCHGIAEINVEFTSTGAFQFDFTVDNFYSSLSFSSTTDCVGTVTGNKTHGKITASIGTANLLCEGTTTAGGTMKIHIVYCFEVV